jgi:phosphomannomutase
VSDSSPDMMADRALSWMRVDPDPDTRVALADVLAGGDLGLLADLVGRRLAFGTAGLRGRMGPGPNRMNRLTVRQCAAGLARVLVAEGPAVASRGVVVGHDARHHSQDFGEDAVAILVDHGIDVLTFSGPVPTPLVAEALRRTGAAAALMVTASHNPAADNGVKVYWRDGAQIVAPVDTRIAAAIEEVATAMSAAGTPAQADAELRPRPGTGAVHALGTATSGVEADAYVAAAVALGDGRPMHPVPVAITSLHGVGGGLVDRVLSEAGHGPLHEVPEQRTPDPDFPTVAFPNPEEPGVLDRVLSVARASGAVVALANDPDADRLAVAAPDRAGRWQRLTGDQTGVLLADHLLERSTHRGERDPLVATTVVSSRLAARVTESAGGHFVETLTGFKWLCRPGLEHPDWTQVLLYEEALGYAIGPEARDKDGINAALAVVDLVAGLAARGRTVWDRLDDLDRRHGAHLTRNGSVDVTGPGWEERLAGLVDRLVSDPPAALGGVDVQRSDRPAPDVLRMWTTGDTRVALRPSGTEPKLKYYCEAVVPVGTDLAVARHVATARLDAVVGDVMALVRA